MTSLQLLIASVLRPKLQAPTPGFPQHLKQHCLTLHAASSSQIRSLNYVPQNHTVIYPGWKPQPHLRQCLFLSFLFPYYLVPHLPPDQTKQSQKSFTVFLNRIYSVLQYILHVAPELSDQNRLGHDTSSGLPLTCKINSTLFSIRSKAVHCQTLYYQLESIHL